MTNADLEFREIALPNGVYHSRMTALSACLKAISSSHLKVEKVAIFEDPPHAFLEISQDKADVSKSKNHNWFSRLMPKTSGSDNKITTLKLMIRRRRSSEGRFVLKYEINPVQN